MLEEDKLQKCKIKMLDLIKGAVPFVNSSDANGIIYKIIYINYFLRKNELLNQKDLDESNDIRDYLLTKSEDQLYKDVVESLNSRMNGKYFATIFAILNDIELEKLKEMVIADYETSIYNMSTPSGINELSYKILETGKGDSVLDICSCYGNFLVNYASKNNDYKYYGKEIYKDHSLVSQIRLYMLEVKNSIICGDVFLDIPEPKYSKIFTNFPLGLRLDMRMLDCLNKPHRNKKIPFEFSNKISADWAFVSMALDYLKDDGKIVTVMSNGSLFKMTDIEYRKKLVELGFVESVISLPEKVFGYSTIACTLLVLSKGNKEVKFIDARKLFNAQRRVNELQVEDIYNEYISKETSEISKVMDNKNLVETDYALIPERYMFDDTFELVNPVKLETVIDDMFRGYQITAEEMDSLIAPSNEAGAYKILNLSNITNNVINYDLATIKPNTDKMDKYLLQDGDVIVSAKSSKIKTAVVEIRNNDKIVASGNLLVLRPNKEKINPIYLKMFFESEKGNKILSSIQTGTIILSINTSQLRKIDVSLIDMEKQNELAKKYLAKLDSIQITKLKLQQLEQELSDICLEEI